MRTWTPEQVARAAGARLISPAPTTTGPERVIIDSREAGPGALFVGLPGRARRRRPLRPAGAGRRGVGGARPRPQHAQDARCATPGALLAAEDPLRSAAAPGHRLAARTGRQRDRRHRLDRQDLDQGPAAGAALAPAADRGLARQLQHRDRAAARDPGGAGRHRGARARDGDARPRPDRRAGRDRRARRRRDRQHRAGPPRAARHARGDRRGQGGADRGAAARRHGGHAGRRAAARAASACRSARRSPSASPGTSGLSVPNEGRVEIDLRGRTIVLEVPFTQAHLRRNLLPAVAAAEAVRRDPRRGGSRSSSRPAGAST